MSEDLQKAISAIKLGDKEAGRRILVRILKSDGQNEFAWLWMTKVVDTNEKRLECLRKVLEINPNNEVAKRGILQLRGEDNQSVKRSHKRSSKKSLRFWLLAVLGLFIFLAFLGRIVTESSVSSEPSVSTKPTEQNQETLIVPAGNLSKYVDDYSNYEEVYIYKQDGTLDDRPNDLEELCLDYVYYRRKILEYEADGKSEKADEARATFKKINLWLDEYDRSDYETMFFEILELGE